MPLPKIPKKPGTLLAPADYPKAVNLQTSKPTLKAATPAPEKKMTQAVSPLLKPAAPPQKKTQTASTPLKTVANQQQKVTTMAPAPEARSKRTTKITPPKPALTKEKAVDLRAKSSTSREADESGLSKLFVLDTNVLMHDPSSLFRFEEHDVYLPMMTLEELDDHKKGMSEVARNARQVSRSLDALVGAVADHAIEEGIPLSKLGNKDAKGRLYFQTKLQNATLPAGLPVGKADNQILGVVRALGGRTTRTAPSCWSQKTSTCASRRAHWVCRQKTTSMITYMEDTDLLYSGILQLPDDFWNKTCQRNGVVAGEQKWYWLYVLPRHRSVRTFHAAQSVRFPGTEELVKPHSMPRSDKLMAKQPFYRHCVTTLMSRTAYGE